MYVCWRERKPDGDARGTDPRVDAAVEALLFERVHELVLDEPEQKVVNPPWEPGDEEAQDVGCRAARKCKVREAHHRHKEKVMEHIVLREFEEEDVVKVQAHNEARGEVRAGWKRQGLAISTPS